MSLGSGSSSPAAKSWLPWPCERWPALRSCPLRQPAVSADESRGECHRLWRNVMWAERPTAMPRALTEIVHADTARFKSDLLKSESVEVATWQRL